jgi:hypothetical protein
MERTGAAGQPSEPPPDYVAIEVPDCVVLDKTWDYNIAHGRQQHFLDAVENPKWARNVSRSETTYDSKT